MLRGYYRGGLLHSDQRMIVTTQAVLAEWLLAQLPVHR
jgi:hypothetical protein